MHIYCLTLQRSIFFARRIVDLGHVLAIALAYKGNFQTVSFSSICLCSSILQLLVIFMWAILPKKFHYPKSLFVSMLKSWIFISHLITSSNIVILLRMLYEVRTAIHFRIPELQYANLCNFCLLPEILDD